MNFFLALALSTSASALPHSKPTIDEFLKACRRTRKTAAGFFIPPPTVGIYDFLPTLAFQATQTRFGFKKLRGNLKELNLPSLPNEHGAAYGIEKAVEAV